ncbi:MAG: hypothetical protein WBM08_06960 [Prochlorococcaceae cyanobacterium]
MAPISIRLNHDQAGDVLNAKQQNGVTLREELERLRATTPTAGSQLNVAALIREERDA